MVAAAMVAPLAIGAASASSATKTTPASEIDDVVTFGNSWSSAIRVFTSSPGGAWPQLLAQSFDTVQAADTEGGENYARGGAFVAPIEGISAEGFPTPVSEQIDAYVAKHQVFDSNQLITLWAGGNDLFAHIGAFDSDTTKFRNGTQTKSELNEITASMSTVADTEVSAVERLLSLGGEKIVVLDMVDLGLTANDACMSADSVAGAMTKVHNLALYKGLSRAGLLDDDRVDFVPISKLFNSIAAAPAKHGFDVVDGDPCPAGSVPCTPDTWPVPNADRTYVFGQSGHFNAHTRELIASTVHESVEAKWAEGTFNTPTSAKIVGKVAVGNVVKASVGAWDPEAAIAYAWFLDGKVIKGATGPSLKLGPTAAGKRVKVVIERSRPGYVSTAVASPGVKVAKGTFRAPKPTILGTAKVGRTLKVHIGTWAPDATQSFQWYVDGRVINGANKSSLKLTSAHRGHKIKVRVTGRRPGYTTKSVTSRMSREVKK